MRRVVFCHEDRCLFFLPSECRFASEEPVVQGYRRWWSSLSIVERSSCARPSSLRRLSVYILRQTGPKFRGAPIKTTFNSAKADSRADFEVFITFPRHPVHRRRLQYDSLCSLFAKSDFLNNCCDLAPELKRCFWSFESRNCFAVAVFKHT